MKLIRNLIEAIESFLLSFSEEPVLAPISIEKPETKKRPGKRALRV